MLAVACSSLHCAPTKFIMSVLEMEFVDIVCSRIKREDVNVNKIM
jgi:hypothetical protein